MANADTGVAELEANVDSLIVVLNEKLQEVLGDDVTQAEMGQRYPLYFPEFVRRGVEAELLEKWHSAADTVPLANPLSAELAVMRPRLLPGLVELHTDNLERHLEPRPGVRWPEVPAILAHPAANPRGQYLDWAEKHQVDLGE